jgi:hypothetical protein
MAFNDDLEQVTSVKEGHGVEIYVQLDGDFPNDPPTIWIWADTNFNARVDLGETREVYIDRGGVGPIGVQGFGFVFPDDGPWPGNGTSSDPVTIVALYDGVQGESTLTVENDVPRFVGKPTLSFAPSSSQQSVVSLSIPIADDGVNDRHAVKVRWGDGTVTQGLDGIVRQVCTEMVGKTLTATRSVTPGVELYPITITVTDDDGGAVSYTLLREDLLLNHDDDNLNGIADLSEHPVATDDDVKAVELWKLLRPEMHPDDGQFVFSYNPGIIRVWDSADKVQLILPYGHYAGGPNGFVDTPTVQYTGQRTVFVEGIRHGTTPITLEWVSNEAIVGWHSSMCEYPFLAHSYGSIDVTVWSLDLDIDSDNDNGFNYPENDDWEEYLEDSPYGIGKMLVPNASHFTPVRLRLPPGLNPNDPSVLVELTTDSESLSSGEIRLWRRAKGDALRKASDELKASDSRYTLGDLRYDPISGAATIWIEAKLVNRNHETMKDVDFWGKPVDFLTTKIAGEKFGKNKTVDDRVKWMAVNPKSYFPTLNDNPVLLDAISSELVYHKASSTKASLLALTKEQVIDIIGETLDGLADFKIKPVDIVTSVLFDEDIGTFPVPQLKTAIYWNHTATDSSSYILAFAGTEDLPDWITNLQNFIISGEPQYWNSMQLSYLLAQVPGFANIQLTGHSLGGGLAAAGSLVSNVPAVTFNASGFPLHTVLSPRDGTPLFGSEADKLYFRADTLIDNYVVYELAPHPDGGIDAPDILNWLQYSSMFLPDALGKHHKIEGLFNLSYSQRGAANQAQAKLADLNDTYTLDAYLQSLFQSGVLYASGATELMTQSHMLPSIFYGLLHNDETGWNVFDRLDHGH